MAAGGAARLVPLIGVNAFDGAGRAGRAGKTVTTTSGKRSMGLSFHYRMCWTPYGGKRQEWIESGVSRDECHIHAEPLLADGAFALGPPGTRTRP